MENLLETLASKNKLCTGCSACLKYINMKQPECYAMMAKDEERLTSSSGGFVPVVARWILEKGGSVFGAAWDENWSVHHIEIEREAELYKIKGSKYLQGNVGRFNIIYSL